MVLLILICSFLIGLFVIYVHLKEDYMINYLTKEDHSIKHSY